LLVPDVCSLASLPPETDLLAAGFPCIDISRAGLKQGLAGQSSGLVAHVFRLLKRAKDDGKPIAWVLLENVEALLDRAGGRTPAIKAITDQLEEIGYHSWAHRVICSAGFGLPNRRKRVFVMASLHGDARDVLLAQGRQKCMGSCTSGSNDKHCYECYQPPIKSVKSSSNEAGPSSSSSSALTELEDIDLSDCSLALDLGNARSAPGIDIVPTFTTQNERMCLILPSGKIGMLRTDDAERLQGLPSGHTKPCWPIVGPGVQQHRSKQIKDADKDSIARARFALIGNAVTVSVARWIGIRLADPYAHKYIASCDDFALPASFTGPGGGPSLKEREDQQEVRVATASVILRQNKKVVPSIFDLPGINGSEEEDAEEGNWDAEEANEGQEAHEDDLEGRGKGPVDPKLLLKRQNETPQEARKDDEDSEDEGDEKHAYGGVAGSKKDGSWPRVAWFLKGHGRFGVTGVSENPVKVPFRPLGEVVKDVGMAPSAEALTVFIQRLREQGWNLGECQRAGLITC
jgi:site-specific DNA-cytosine methylase